MPDKFEPKRMYLEILQVVIIYSTAFRSKSILQLRMLREFLTSTRILQDHVQPNEPGQKY